MIFVSFDHFLVRHVCQGTDSADYDTRNKVQLVRYFDQSSCQYQKRSGQIIMTISESCKKVEMPQGWMERGIQAI